MTVMLLAVAWLVGVPPCGGGGSGDYLRLSICALDSRNGADDACIIPRPKMQVWESTTLHGLLLVFSDSC